MKWTWLFYLSILSVAIAFLTFLFSGFFIRVMRDGVLVQPNRRGEPIPTGLGAVIPLMFLIVAPVQYIAAQTTQVTWWIGSYPFAVFFILTLSAGMSGIIFDCVEIKADPSNANTGKKLFLLLTWILVSVCAVLIQYTDIKLVILYSLTLILFMNLTRLLNTGPGRAVKFSIFLIALVTGLKILFRYIPPHTAFQNKTGHIYLPLFLMLIAVLPYDLREKAKLGNAGANILGAVLGLLFIWELEVGKLWFVLGGLAFLNLLAVFISYSKLIDSIFFLRWIDRFGTLPDR